MSLGDIRNFNRTMETYNGDPSSRNSSLHASGPKDSGFCQPSQIGQELAIRGEQGVDYKPSGGGTSFENVSHNGSHFESGKGAGRGVG
jgi:hypothetical protein